MENENWEETLLREITKVESAMEVGNTVAITTCRLYNYFPNCVATLN